MSYLTCAHGGAVTMTFAIDLKDEGITVICYCPGWCALCLLLPHCLNHVHGTSAHDGPCPEADKRGVSSASIWSELEQFLSYQQYRYLHGLSA